MKQVVISSDKVITKQFHGTPIAEAVDDLPEGTELSVGDVLKRIRMHLMRARQHVVIAQGKTYRRWGTVEYFPQESYRPEYHAELIEDKERTAQILAVTQPIREAVLRFASAVGIADPSTVDIHLTPIVQNEQQMILHETREQRALAEPDKSQRVLSVQEEQYTVFERSNDGEWRQKAVLPFYIVRTYADDPDVLEEQLYDVLDDEYDEKSEEELAGNIPIDELIDLEAKMEAIEVEPLRNREAIMSTPYPRELFDTGTPENADTYYTGVHQEVFVSFPHELDFPPPYPPSSDTLY